MKFKIPSLFPDQTEEIEITKEMLKGLERTTKRKRKIQEEQEKIEEEQENRKVYFVYYNDSEEENKFFKERINYIGMSEYSYRRADQHNLWSGNFCITYSKTKAKIIESALINYFSHQLKNKQENPVYLKDKCICDKCKRVHLKPNNGVAKNE
jgi:hypothetical protein